MSDSDEELVPEAAKVRAPNRHRFKTVSERIDEVVASIATIAWWSTGLMQMFDV